MAEKPAPGLVVEDVNKRTFVFFGTLTKKRKDNTGAVVNTPRTYIASCRKEIADGLNLRVPTPAEETRTVGGREVTVRGARNGKTIIVDAVPQQKTPKGGNVTWSLQVPTNATVKEIKAFLKTGGKAKSFKIKGGYSYTVT